MSNLKKISPFLIIGILTIVFAVYKWIYNSNGLDMISVYLLLIVGIIVLLVDFGFREWLKTFKKIAFIELIIIGILISANQYKYNRVKTLEIPIDLSNQYITIIYGVDGQPDLGITDFTLAKNIKIPDNGILMTSSKYDIDFVDFCKEIFLNKDIAVKTLDRPKNNPLIRGKVEDIDLYFYKDEYYIKVKVDDEWHLIENNVPLTIYYPDDFKNKPLHKELIEKKIKLLQK